MQEVKYETTNDGAKAVRFGDRFYRMDRVEGIARVCHEANRAYQCSINEEPSPAWEQAPDWMRQSAINGVLFHLAHDWKEPPSPEASHNAWLREKLAAGWSWGPTKNPAKKQHPCMMLYWDLPESQRLKDRLFSSIVAGLRHC